MRLASKLAWLLCALIMTVASFVYYPKWNKAYTEAIISWDVAGYYAYLPAIFIYKDLHTLSFMPEINATYKPTAWLDQSIPHSSGSQVLKYSAGLAIHFLPAFLVAHALAEPLGFPPDGYSLPYQLSIQIWSFLWSLLGLWMLRRVLLLYFSEGVTAATLLTLVLASNYLNFASIDLALPHQWLFGWYAILIWFTIRFYRRAGYAHAIMVGLAIGMMALTRPTELMAALIPLLWGLERLSQEAIRTRYQYLRRHSHPLLAAVLVSLLVGSIQLVYWKYVSGDWLVYSYGEQGFSWLRPHVLDYLFSYRSGWLVYTPLMIFALAGMLLFRRRESPYRVAVIVYLLATLYVVTAWDIWWYGGRAMVQSYVVLSFPLAVLITWVGEQRWRVGSALVVLGGLTYYNIWYTYQIHTGGKVFPYDMTRAYFWKVVGRWNPDRDLLIYLDTRDVLRSKIKASKVLLAEDFEGYEDLTYPGIYPIEGRYSEFLIEEKLQTRMYEVPYQQSDGNWLRATAMLHTPEKEWEPWHMTCFVVGFYKEDQRIHERFIRVQRIMDHAEKREITFDVKVPRQKDFDSVRVHFRKHEMGKPVLIDHLRVEALQTHR